MLIVYFLLKEENAPPISLAEQQSIREFDQAYGVLSELHKLIQMVTNIFFTEILGAEVRFVFYCGLSFYLGLPHGTMWFVVESSASAIPTVRR